MKNGKGSLGSRQRAPIALAMSFVASMTLSSSNRYPTICRPMGKPAEATGSTESRKRFQGLVSSSWGRNGARSEEGLTLRLNSSVYGVQGDKIGRRKIEHRVDSESGGENRAGIIDEVPAGTIKNQSVSLGEKGEGKEGKRGAGTRRSYSSNSTSLRASAQCVDLPGRERRRLPTVASAARKPLGRRSSRS